MADPTTEQLNRMELQLLELQGKIDATLASAEKTRNILKWTGIVTVGAILIPLVLLPAVIPSFLNSTGVTSAELQGL
ncbi:MAG: hypothetical protein JWO43_223 [Candidatus Adlerbacteria bacterium]|nr:hypothetical protein [Candidatus Adlerbacteria bacterium]